MNNNCSLAGYMLEEPSIIIRLSYLLYIFINIYTFYYMHNNNYRCKLCWNKALTFGCFSYHCVHPIHAKMFPIQILLHFSQIVRRVCTLVLFINPRRACARVTVLVLSVCVSVCVSVCLCVCFPYSGTSRNQAYKQQYQRLQRDTGMKFKKGFFFKTLRSEVMVSFTHLE